MSHVDSYVLFAANIDDFRSVANKIIPGRLADQLANMASKRDNLNHRHDVTDAARKDSTDDSSRDANSDESTEDSNYSEAFYKISKPLLKDKLKFSKKKYTFNNKDIDLDELVKRVKEKLEIDYKLTTNDRYKVIKPRPVVTPEMEDKLEDYNYKDKALSDMKYEVVYKKPISPAIITEPDIPNVNQYDGVNIDFNDEDTKASVYLEDNIEKTEYVQEDPNENMDYNPVTQKQFSFVATQEQAARDGNTGQENRKIDKYGDKIKEIQSIKKPDKKNPEYYEDNSERPTAVNVDNQKDMNTQKDIQPNLKEAAEYYDDNVKETQIEPAKDNGYLFKKVDMLKDSNDSYEDYVTPKRDDIFDSAEPSSTKSYKPISSANKITREKTQFKLEHSRSKNVSDSHKLSDPRAIIVNDEVIKPPSRKVSGSTSYQKYVKAKTASMWYKDPNIENYDDSTKKIKDNANKKTTKKRLRTMFPTKAHLKISSPNYFAILPAVAEKYNFDEPIPEKDREPEVIKDIGNPPATINKKVIL